MPNKPFEVPDDVVEKVRAKVDGERFETAGDVIRESLIALEQRDESFDAWLREIVIPADEEMKAHPERALSVDQVRARLADRARRARRSS